MIYLRQSTASQEILLGPFVDDTDGKTAETGLTINNTDIKIHVAGATTLASKNSGGATHISNGNYYAVMDATDTATIGSGAIVVQVSGALAFRVAICILDEAVYDAWFGTTAIATATNITAGTITTATNVTTVNGLAANVITATSINADAITAAKIAADVTTEIWAGSTAPSAATVAAAVWDLDATGHQTQGTFGQAIGDPVADTNTIYKAVVSDATGATVGVDVVAIKAETVNILADTAEIGTAGAGLTNINLPNQTMDIVGNVTGNLSGSVGSVTGAVGSVTGAVGSVTGNVGGNVTGTIGGLTAAALKDFFDTDSTTTYASAVAGSVVKEIADNAGGASLTAADIADAVWDEAATGHTDAGKAGAQLWTDIDAILVDTAEIGAAGAGLTAINLPDQTMNITGDITGNLSGSVGSVTGAVGSVTGNVGGSVASVTAGVTLANDAITAAKFDESTAFPLTSADTGSTAVARTGADSDTLETLSDQLDAKSSQASVDDLPTNSELATALAAADDAVLAAIAALNNLSAAQVNAEVVDALNVDTYAESGVPAATASLAAKIRWLATLARNKITQTSTTQTLRNDADSGDLATSTHSDSGGTYTRSEWT